MANRSISVYLRAQVDDFKRQMDEAAKASESVGKKARQSSEEATTGLGRLTSSAIDNREEWDRAGTTLTAFGAATVAALGYSAKAAIDWESAWAGVAKTVDGSGEQMAALEGDLRELAKTLPASHQEIAAVAEAAGQLGVGVDGITSFTKTMIDLGETTNLSSDEAATAIAQMANIMGLRLDGSSDDVQRFGATLVELGNNGASTESEILMMAQRIAGAGKLAGASSGEVLALANALASMGVTAELGGGVASRVLQDLYTAVQSGGAELAGFAEVAGMSARDFATAFGEDPIRALGSFTTGLNDVEASGGNVVTTLTDLGFRSTEEQRILLQLKASGDLLSRSLDDQAEAWASNSALIEEAGKRYDTAEARIQVAKNSLNDTAITLGETFLPMIATGADQVAQFAQTIGNLPEPLLTAGGALGALVGATSLAGGGFLLLFPRVVETVQAFRTLQQTGSGIPALLSRVGRTATIVGSALAVMAASAAIPQWGVEVSEGASTTAAALLDVASGAQTAEQAFSGMLASGSLKDWFTGNDVDNVEKAYQVLKDPGVSQNVDNVISSVLTLGQSTSTSRLQAQELFGAIDEGLSSLVQSGAVDQAAAALREMGIPVEDQAELLPLYADALAAADNQQRLTGDSASALAGAMSETEAATAAADEELQKWLEDVAATDAAFVDAYGAYDTLIQKNKDAAQATADATESAEDSWETFYNGFSVSTEEYLAELQRQVDAQTSWETNLLLLSGRVSQGTIDELYRMGSEGAPLVAQLVTASDEELARMETLFGERSTTATGNFAAALNDAGPVIRAAAATLGADAAAEIATRLASGTYTVEQIMAEYGITIDGLDPTVTVSADTENAAAELNNFIGTWNNKTISVSRAAVTYSASGGMPGGGTATTPPGHADGGPIFGAGTETSDSILRRLSHNEHVWSAAEVRGAGGHVAVASMRAAARTGTLPGSIPGFRNGGSPGFSAPAALAIAPVLSLEGMRLTGTLDLGNGLTGLIDARVDAGLANQKRADGGSRSTAGVVR